MQGSKVQLAFLVLVRGSKIKIIKCIEVKSRIRLTARRGLKKTRRGLKV